jgi:hypothetical protein
MHLYNLSRLRDATKFLNGARIPLHDPARPTDGWEWINDRPYVRRPGEVAFVPVAQPAWPSTLAMDLGQAHVARSVDQRIAGAVGHFGGLVPASLVASLGYGWMLREGPVTLELWDAPGVKATYVTRDALVCSAVLAAKTALKNLKCEGGHLLPDARAILLDALFGVNATVQAYQPVAAG